MLYVCGMKKETFEKARELQWEIENLTHILNKDDGITISIKWRSCTLPDCNDWLTEQLKESAKAAAKKELTRLQKEFDNLK